MAKGVRKPKDAAAPVTPSGLGGEINLNEPTVKVTEEQPTVNATDMLAKGLQHSSLQNFEQDVDFPMINETDLLMQGLNGGNAAPTNTVQPPVNEEPAKTVMVHDMLGGYQTGLPSDKADVDKALATAGGRPLRIKVIKRIPSKGTKLGLEKYTEKETGFTPSVMPGASYMWEPSVLGNGYKTGLTDKPDVRKRLERQLGVSLAPDSPFYSNLRFRLEDKPHGNLMNFDDSRNGPFYETVYYAMTESHLISIGLTEKHTGIKPEAEWYVEDTEQDAEIEMKEMEKEREAYNLYEGMSYARRRGVAKILGLKVYGLGDNATNTTLWKYIKENAANAKLFKEKAELRDDVFAIKVLIKDAIKYNVIRRSASAAYEYKGVMIGTTEEQVEQKLILVENQDLVIQIKGDVQIKSQG